MEEETEVEVEVKLGVVREEMRVDIVVVCRPSEMERTFELAPFSSLTSIL